MLDLVRWPFSPLLVCFLPHQSQIDTLLARLQNPLLLSFVAPTQADFVLKLDCYFATILHQANYYFVIIPTLIHYL